MSTAELQAKAHAFIEARAWDKALWKFHDTVKHYPSWVEHDDFQRKFNIGVREIAKESRRLSNDPSGDAVSFSIGEIGGVRFAVGSRDRFVELPDGDALAYKTIELILAGRVAMSVEFRASSNILGDLVPEGIYVVHEFHNDPSIPALFSAFEEAIASHSARRAQEDADEQNARLEGKFTF